ncbi:MAG: PPC domain-containing protein [Verrucomicrobiae bacterium]|nr:PPC domain-containing protein [Verrucomicrobiae bacterium]
MTRQSIAPFPLRLASALAAACAASALAQLPSAELHTVYPAAAAAGQTVEVSLTGANLDELAALRFSDPRVKAEPVMLPASEFRKYPAQDGTKFRVTVPADLPEGTVEVRAAGLYGLTTSRPFRIVAKDTPVVIDAGAPQFSRDTAPELPLEAVACGRTDANQVDYWKFTAKKDQRLLVHCRAERLDSRADATLVVVDASGRELENNRDTVGRDPMVDFTAPADGVYFVGVHDFLFNGSADHPYLLTVSAKPRIDFVFPPAGQQGQVMEATLFGRNLPGGSPGEGLALRGKPIETVSARIPVPASVPAPGFDPRRPAHGLVPSFSWRLENSNAVRIGFAEAPVVVENAASELQAAPVPCEIAGRFDADADEDSFRVTLKKGAVYWVEAIGDRLAGVVDPYLVVEKIAKDAEGKETFARVKDDDDESGEGGATFDDASRDAVVSFTADQDGDYRVTIANQFGDGGLDRLYRLSIREAKPDFQLLVAAERPYLDAKQAFPAAPLLRKGGTTPLKVLLHRRDGFDGAVTLAAEGLPAGVACPPVTVSGKDDTAYLILKAAPGAAAWTGDIRVTGKAQLGGAEAVRDARIGAVTWGLADTTKDRLRARLETSIPLAVSAEEKAPTLIEVADPRPLTVEIGQKLEIPVKLAGKENVKGAIAIAPDGLRGLAKPPTLNIDEKAGEGKLTIDFTPRDKVFAPEPGVWSFVLKGTGTVKYRQNAKAADRAAEEQKLTDELHKKYTDEAAKAKAAAEAAKKEADTAAQKVAAAANDAALQKAAADAKARADAAQTTATDLERKRAAAEKEKTAVAARLKAATDKAKEKDVKFVAYSLPLTVEVKPAPEKK